MPVTTLPASPATLTSVFAALYGAPGETLTRVLGELTGAWVARSDAGEVLGAVGLRPSPTHGAELFGGAGPGPGQAEAARVLAHTARAAGRTYAYAEDHLFPLAALEAAGYREVGAYRLLAGPTPTVGAEPPGGIRFLSPAGGLDTATHLAALATYGDRIGHHAPMPEHTAPEVGGFNPGLSLIAVDGRGRAAGICSALVVDGCAHIGSPGVRPDLRHTALRAALLLGVCALARARGLDHIRVESWGDTPQEVAQDLGLGLRVEVETPILAAG